MNGENTEGNSTTRAITELQESLQLMCEKMKVTKTIDCIYPYDTIYVRKKPKTLIEMLWSVRKVIVCCIIGRCLVIYL